MFGFPKYVLRVKVLRPCHCGARSFSLMRSLDAVHCNDCGAMYLVDPSVMNPVVELEQVKVSTDAT